MANQNKPAPEETGAELKKESSVSDVMNANENAEFSKTEDKATEGRVSNNSVGPEVGASNQTADADIAAREKRLADREKEVALREEKVSVKEAEVLEVAKPAKAVELTFEGEKYVFDKHAPQSIRVDDVVYTQKEIAKNEEVLLSLIGGNSSLIKKL